MKWLNCCVCILSCKGCKNINSFPIPLLVRNVFDLVLDISVMWCFIEYTYILHGYNDYGVHSVIFYYCLMNDNYKLRIINQCLI